LPRWRGFNLLSKFTLEGDEPYVEWDLDFMAEWGFDFVRLPTDYRIWTTALDTYREQPLREIDQVIAWARQRGIHVNLCLHRAPGYCVNAPQEPLDLWADGAGGQEARRQFAAQWRMFAERYRGIPSDELSFNLVNEPANVTADQYVRAAAAAVAAIWQGDPDRLIIADGADYGMRPVPELTPLRVAQSTRGYVPMLVSHYRASWVDGSDAWPVPTWPMVVSINQYLYGDEKPELQSPLVLEMDLPRAAQMTIKVHQVSHQARLVVHADGITVLDKWLQPGPGQGEWQESTFKPEWGIYQAVYDKEYTATLPAHTRQIRFAVSTGDWLSFSEIRFSPCAGAPAGQLVLRPGETEWGLAQEAFTVDAGGNVAPVSGGIRYSRETLWTNWVEPWKTFAATGVGVHVGEWGVYSFTPHTVTLAWMSDCLQNWQRAGMGWALWNLRGSFGVLDSNRADVVYELHRGHQLDRKMLELLRQG
jgi:aryl-phospho-beta-D-glucosidase BglC (GH1 family)